MSVFHCRCVVCACSAGAVGSFSNKPLSPKKLKGFDRPLQDSVSHGAHFTLSTHGACIPLVHPCSFVSILRGDFAHFSYDHWPGGFSCLITPAGRHFQTFTGKLRKSPQLASRSIPKVPLCPPRNLHAIAETCQRARRHAGAVTRRRLPVAAAASTRRRRRHALVPVDDAMVAAAH